MVLKKYRFTTGRVTGGEPAEAVETIGTSTMLLIGDRTYGLLEAVGAALVWGLFGKSRLRCSTFVLAQLPMR
jgi:hypothetical protein